MTGEEGFLRALNRTHDGERLTREVRWVPQMGLECRGPLERSSDESPDVNLSRNSGCNSSKMLLDRSLTSRDVD